MAAPKIAIDPQKLIEAIDSGKPQAEILADFGLKGRLQLQSAYLKALMTIGRVKPIVSSRLQNKAKKKNYLVVNARGSLIIPWEVASDLGFSSGDRVELAKNKTGATIKKVRAESFNITKSLRTANEKIGLLKVHPLDLANSQTMTKVHPLDIANNQSLSKAHPLDIANNIALNKITPSDFSKSQPGKKPITPPAAASPNYRRTTAASPVPLSFMPRTPPKYPLSGWRSGEHTKNSNRPSYNGNVIEMNTAANNNEGNDD